MSEANDLAAGAIAGVRSSDGLPGPRSGAGIPGVSGGAREAQLAVARSSGVPEYLKRPKRIKCKRCAGNGKRNIHCLTLIPCYDCDGRGYTLAGDPPRRASAGAQRDASEPGNGADQPRPTNGE